MTTPKDIIEQFFIDKYKIEFGSDLLHNSAFDHLTGEERLDLYNTWKPHSGQRAQAEGDAHRLITLLDEGGYLVTEKEKRKTVHPERPDRYCFTSPDGDCRNPICPLHTARP